MSNLIRLSNDGKQFEVVSEYDPHLVEMLRAVKVHAWTTFKKKAGWNGSVWAFPFEVLPQVLEGGFAFEVEDGVKAGYQQTQHEIIEKESARDAYERRFAALRERALRNLRPAAPLANNRVLFPHQQEAVIKMVTDGKEILADDMGLGKANSVSTLVLTPNGWIEIGRIKVGDCVIGSSGLPTEVLGVFPQGVKDNFRVWFSDESSVEATDEHLWTVGYWKGGSHLSYLTLTTSQMRSGAIIDQIRPNGQKSKLNLGKVRLYLPMLSKPVEFSPSEPLPIQPYLFGALIANGGLTHEGSTVYTNALDGNEIEARFVNDGVDFLRHEYGTVTRFYIRGIRSALRSTKINCHSTDKFIPRLYLQASPDDRIALLHGLMDGDGSISKTHCRVTYHTTSHQLANDVQELVEGLGGIASVRTYERSKENKPTEYQVRIRVPTGILPFSTTRKLSRYQPGRLAQPCRTFAKAEYSRTVESVCIRVAAADHLYVTEHCILTHNSISSLVASAAFELPIHLICPAGLIDNWKDEIAGSGVKVAGIHSWAKLPASIEGEYVLIIDEAHYAQSMTSLRTKAALKLTSSLNCMAVFPLTGTPMPNGQPQNMYPILKMIDHEVAKDKRNFDLRYCDAQATRWTRWDTSGARNLDELHELTKDRVIRRMKDKVLHLPPMLRSERFITMSAEQQTRYDISRKSDLWRYKHNTINRSLQDEDALTDAEMEEQIAGIDDDDVMALSVLMADRKAASAVKVDAAVEITEEVLEQGGQVVLFTMFKSTAAKIAQQFDAEGAAYTSETKDKAQLVKSFQAGKLKVLVCTFGAGNVGITLTAAQTVILIDRPWRPGDAAQAEDRLRRIGQHETVYAIWLQCDDTDKEIDLILKAKQHRIDQALGGEVKTMRGVSDGVLTIARKKLKQLQLEVER